MAAFDFAEQLPQDSDPEGMRRWRFMLETIRTKFDELSPDTPRDDPWLAYFEEFLWRCRASTELDPEMKALVLRGFTQALAEQSGRLRSSDFGRPDAERRSQPIRFGSPSELLDAIRRMGG